MKKNIYDENPPPPTTIVIYDLLIQNYIDMDRMGRLNRPRNMIKGNLSRIFTPCESVDYPSTVLLFACTLPQYTRLRFDI